MTNFLVGKLKAYRQEHGLTQKQLASMLYVTDKAVSKWERGAGYPDIETLKHLALLLNLSLDELLHEREPIRYFEYKSSIMFGMLPLLHVIIPNFALFFRRSGIFWGNEA